VFFAIGSWAWRRNTVMIRASKRFLDQVLWPEFSNLTKLCRPTFIS
jgi:hypothetical protein